MKKSSAILALATTLISSAALADSGTTASSTAVAPSVLSKITAMYIGLYHGPQLLDPISSKQPDQDGNLTGQLLESSVLAGYKITDTLNAGAMVNWNTAVGQGVTLVDPALNVTKAKLINAGAFTMTSYFRAYLGVTDGSRAANMLTQLRNINVLNYDVPKTKLSLGLITSERFYLYGDNSVDGQRVARLYAGPMVNYQLLPTVAVGVLGEVESVYNRGQQFFNVPDGNFDIEPNVSWDVTPKININPFLNFYPTKFSADSSSIGVLMTAKFL